MMSSRSSSSSSSSSSRSHRDATITHVPLTGNLSSCCPLFVDDFSALICASGSLIQSISSKTGELIGSFTGHVALVTCIRSIGTVSSPNTLNSVTEDPLQSTKQSIHVVSSSIDGMVIVWNKKSFQEISRVLVHAPVYDIIIPSSSLQGTFLGGSNSHANQRLSVGFPADRTGRISALSSSSQSSSSSGIRPSSSTTTVPEEEVDQPLPTTTTTNTLINKQNELYLVIGKKLPSPPAVTTTSSPLKNSSVKSVVAKGVPHEGGDYHGYQLVCYDAIACKIRYNLSAVRYTIDDIIYPLNL